MSARTRARRENIAKRALYARNAALRVAKAVLGGKSVKDAVASERRLFVAHKRVSEDSLKVAREIDALTAIHGPILSWHHGPRTPTDRPHHVAADGHNFDVSSGVPAQTGSYPGVLPNCKCFIGRPIDGAEMLR